MKIFLGLLLVLTAAIMVDSEKDENKGIMYVKEMAKPFLTTNMLNKIGICMKKCDCIDEVANLVDMECSTYDKGNDWIGCMGKCLLEDLGLMVRNEIIAKRGTAVSVCLKYVSPEISTLCAFSGAFDKCWGAKPKKGSLSGIAKAIAWAKCCCFEAEQVMEIIGGLL